MRLIDADEIPFRKELGDMSDNPKMFVFKFDVDKISTIDPASLRPKGEWISVEDRLPEEHTTVLVLCKNGAMFTGYCFCDYCDDMRWKIHTALSSTKLLNKGRVSHWMPLPEPPNTEVAHDS